MAILVTGGAGYIGSLVAELFLNNRENVVILDNLSRGDRCVLPREAIFYQGDIGDQKLVAEIVNRHGICECVHLAAFTYVGESVVHPKMYYENNVLQGVRLIDTLLKHNIERFIFSSSCAVYGEPTYLPIDESHSLRPINPYGESKLFLEKYLRQCSRKEKFSYIALRYFNAAGALEESKYCFQNSPRVIPEILKVANGQKSYFKVHGDQFDTYDGTAIRDYTHVVDIASAHCKALEYLRNRGKSEEINLGQGVGYSILEILEIAAQVTQTEIPTKIFRPQNGDPSCLIASSEKALEVLGWLPKHSDIKNIIASTWKSITHYSNHFQSA